MLAAAIVAAARPGFAQNSSASGTLLLNGRPTPLNYAYANAQPGFFDKASEDVRVLLSDVALTDEDRHDAFALIHLGRDGKVNIVEVVLDRVGDPISGAIYAKPFNGMVSLAGIHRFDRRRFDHDAVSGTLHTREPSEFEHVTFEYHADFSAVIPRPPTPARVAAVLASPPAQAAGAYLLALRQGRMPALLDALTTEASAAYRQADGASRFAQLRAEVPVDTKVTGLKQLSETSAVATVQGHQRGVVIEYELQMTIENGAWKVARDR